MFSLHIKSLEGTYGSWKQTYAQIYQKPDGFATHYAASVRPPSSRCPLHHLIVYRFTILASHKFETTKTNFKSLEAIRLKKSTIHKMAIP